MFKKPFVRGQGRIVLIVCIMVMGVLSFAPSDVVDAGGSLSLYCTALNESHLDNLWAGAGPNLPGSYVMVAGETITVHAGPPDVNNPTEVRLYINDILVAAVPYPGYSIVYTFAADTIVSSVWATVGNGPGVTWDISCSHPVTAGSDMIPIPDTAVSGAFTTATELLFAPDAGAGTGKIVPPGMTLWVFGLDKSGMYYKVALSGILLWVPVDNVGPNYDPVWNGKPLPTEIVE